MVDIAKREQNAKELFKVNNPLIVKSFETYSWGYLNIIPHNSDLILLSQNELFFSLTKTAFHSLNISKRLTCAQMMHM